MANPEEIKSNSVQETAVKTADKLQDHLKGLEKFGAFDLLESVVDNVQNLNPERKARKKRFQKRKSAIN
jgi:hypothetical protein